MHGGNEQFKLPVLLLTLIFAFDARKHGYVIYVTVDYILFRTHLCPTGAFIVILFFHIELEISVPRTSK